MSSRTAMINSYWESAVAESMVTSFLVEGMRAQITQ
jgi:hypothetical protein